MNLLLSLLVAQLGNWNVFEEMESYSEIWGQKDTFLYKIFKSSPILL